MTTKNVVLITGATGGLGKSVTEIFLANEFEVAVSYRTEESLERLRGLLAAGQEGVFPVKADIRGETQVAEMVATVDKHFGRLNSLVNVIGGWQGGQTIAETPETTWDSMMAMNLRSVFLCCKAAFPYLARQAMSSIVNVSSRSAVQITAGNGPYAVAKRGVITLTEVLAEEGREQNVRANAVLPSIIDTAANRSAMPNADFSKWVKPEEIASVIHFLTSAEAKVVSGAAVPVYGQA